MIVSPTIPSLRRMAFIVGAMHVVILMGSIWQIEYKAQKQSPTRLVVHTIAPAPISTPVIQEVAPPSPLPLPLPVQEVPREEEEVPPKNQEKEVIPVKKEKPKETKVEKRVETKIETKVEAKKEAVKKEKVAQQEKKAVEKKAPSIDKKMLKALQQELQEARDVDTHVPVAPRPHPSLPQLSNKAPAPVVASPLSSHVEENYISQLKQHLQDTLRLPDIGEITIGLRLTPQGKVVGMEILKKTSILNERYVLEEIPKLAFPAWGNGVEERYFPITLRSK